MLFKLYFYKKNSKTLEGFDIFNTFEEAREAQKKESLSVSFIELITDTDTDHVIETYYVEVPGDTKITDLYTKSQIAYFTQQGKKGGASGGLKAASNMTPKQRSERARKAVAAREAKRITTHQMRNKS